MRSPNQAAIKSKCLETISKLLEKFELAPAKTIILDQNGWVNPCFFVDDSYVVRFNARDPELPKFQREKLVYDLLRTSEIPVPQKVYLDESKTVSSYDVLISERVQGSSLEPAWGSLSSFQRADIARKAGLTLSGLHLRNFNFFGELAACGPLPQTKTWFDYVKAKLDFHLQQAHELSLFSDEEMRNFSLALERTEGVLNECARASLIHGDYHFGNILTLNASLSAILDFEWALAGDPLYDLCDWLDPKAEICEGSQAAFLEGYGKPPLGDKELLRLEVYRMIRNIELAIVAKLHYEPAEILLYKQRTLDHFHTQVRPIP